MVHSVYSKKIHNSSMRGLPQDVSLVVHKAKVKRLVFQEVVGDVTVQVDPYDIEAIADGLHRLIEDASLRTLLREKRLERGGQFNWDKTAEQTWRVLAEA